MVKDINFDDFSKIDIRVGCIVDAYLNKDSVKPAYILSIDFGSIGILKSSAQLTRNYKTNDLIGIQITAIVNLPKKQIGKTMSSCLVLAAVDDENTTLIKPSKKVINGTIIS
ncbi:tRNA-binding protein [Flavobacteriaceae bacterium]|nr:tRNA-binding protein [Flavobacteriaceae bacterium]